MSFRPGWTMTDIDFESIWTDAFLEEVEQRKEKSDYDPSEWRAGGRVSKAWPNKEDSTWWLSNGPHMLQQWADWWERSKGEGWTVWTTPTGVPAVELPVMAIIGSVPLRGYIDAILVDPDGDLCLMDWKTSAREPEAPVQLGAYRVAVQKTLNVEVNLGTYYLARKGDMGHVYDLSIYTEKLVGPWLQRAKAMQDQGLFIPKPSSLCSACGVRPFCAVMSDDPASLAQVPTF